jgi:hypothetical protein
MADNKPGEPTPEMIEAMKKAGIDPEVWLKNAKKPQEGLADLLKKKR